MFIEKDIFVSVIVYFLFYSLNTESSHRLAVSSIEYQNIWFKKNLSEASEMFLGNSICFYFVNTFSPSIIKIIFLCCTM